MLVEVLLAAIAQTTSFAPVDGWSCQGGSPSRSRRSATPPVLEAGFEKVWEYESKFPIEGDVVFDSRFVIVPTRVGALRRDLAILDRRTGRAVGEPISTGSAVPLLPSFSGGTLCLGSSSSLIKLIEIQDDGSLGRLRSIIETAVPLGSPLVVGERVFVPRGYDLACYRAGRSKPDWVSEGGAVGILAANRGVVVAHTGLGAVLFRDMEDGRVLARTSDGSTRAFLDQSSAADRVRSHCRSAVMFAGGDVALYEYGEESFGRLAATQPCYGNHSVGRWLAGERKGTADLDLEHDFDLTLAAPGFESAWSFHGTYSPQLATRTVHVDESGELKLATKPALLVTGLIDNASPSAAMIPRPLLDGGRFPGVVEAFAAPSVAGDVLYFAGRAYDVVTGWMLWHEPAFEGCPMYPVLGGVLVVRDERRVELWRSSSTTVGADVGIENELARGDALVVERGGSAAIERAAKIELEHAVLVATTAGDVMFARAPGSANAVEFLGIELLRAQVAPLVDRAAKTRSADVAARVAVFAEPLGIDVEPLWEAVRSPRAQGRGPSDADVKTLEQLDASVAERDRVLGAVALSLLEQLVEPHASERAALLRFAAIANPGDEGLRSQVLAIAPPGTKYATEAPTAVLAEFVIEVERQRARTTTNEPVRVIVLSAGLDQLEDLATEETLGAMLLVSLEKELGEALVSLRCGPALVAGPARLLPHVATAAFESARVARFLASIGMASDVVESPMPGFVVVVTDERVEGVARSATTTGGALPSGLPALAVPHVRWSTEHFVGVTPSMTAILRREVARLGLDLWKSQLYDAAAAAARARTGGAWLEAGAVEAAAALVASDVFDFAVSAPTSFARFAPLDPERFADEIFRVLPAQLDAAAKEVVGTSNLAKLHGADAVLTARDRIAGHAGLVVAHLAADDASRERLRSAVAARFAPAGDGAVPTELFADSTIELLRAALHRSGAPGSD